MGRRLDPKAVPYTKADGSTSYRVRLRVGGRQTTETFPNEDAANVFIAHMLDPAIGPERAVELRDREDTRSPAYVPTLREALAHHVETLTGVDDRTRTDYLAVASRNWLPSSDRCASTTSPAPTSPAGSTAPPAHRRPSTTRTRSCPPP